MSKAKRARYWVLRDSISDSYFGEWTSIGPRCTKRRGDGERFPSKRKALQSRAHSFPLTSFEPEAVR